jgi:hypothetical protein
MWEKEKYEIQKAKWEHNQAYNNALKKIQGKEAAIHGARQMHAQSEKVLATSGLLRHAIVDSNEKWLKATE